MGCIRRIGFWAGPGSGKSTVAARVFSELKTEGRCVEFIHEYVKEWAYLKREPKSFDQVHLVGQQMQAEFLVLSRGVDLIVSECPVLMNCAYAHKLDFIGADELTSLCKKFEQQFPSLNIFLHRSHPYQNWGRYEDEEAADEMGDRIRAFLEKTKTSYHCFESHKIDAVLSCIRSALSD